MHKRPICPMCKEREGWVYFHGQFVCGECISEYNTKVNKQELDRMREVLNGD